MRAALAIAFVMLASLMLAQPHGADPAAQERALPKIAPAPDFALISQDGAPVKLADYRGKVVAVTFIFTLCADTCPVLTPMMSFVQDQLGNDFGEKIRFVSITIDPERDTPEVLKEYAHAFGANLSGWSFLTGPPEAIRDVTRRYGVFIDRRGILRVQYLGVRFDPEEFRRDLVSLVKEQ